MNIINATSVRQNFFEILENTVKFNDPVHITSKHGNAVLISEDDYSCLLETLYLLSNPKTAQELLEGIDAPDEDFVGEEEIKW